MCCVYQRRKFSIGSVIDTVLSEDGCTTTSLKCVPNGNKAKIEMKIKNDCPKPASEDTLIMYMDELKDLLEKHVNETPGKTLNTITNHFHPIISSCYNCCPGHHNSW
jgi:hypothetical protein